MDIQSGLLTGAIAGAFGLGYFVYGKKQGNPVALIAGIVLMVYPYFIDSLAWTIVIGVALIIAPFVIRLEV